MSAATIAHECRVAPDHPAFAGHFPGAPVLPGVALLTMVIEAAADAELLGESALCLEQVKFLAPAGPGQALRIEMRTRGRGVDFAIHGETAELARGRLTMMDAA